MIINTSSFTSAIPVAPSDTINIPGPTVRFRDASTATTPDGTPNQLIDTKANFITTYNADGSLLNQGVSVGMVVYNMFATISSGINAPLVATIVSVVNNTTLLLSADIFPFAGGTAVSAYNIYDANEVSPPGAQLYVGTAGNVYVETINGDLVFIEDVPVGEILPIVVQKVLVGAAAAGGQPNTLTTAGKLTAFI
jgi:hypothetical protein|tara:strand:- start:2015 stop:2599 length:585 start_codon:yes stop_codon:yes gene_type:complete